MPQNELSHEHGPLRLGTRGSKLALVQADMVAQALRALGAACEIVILKTSGDRIQDRPLADAGGKGLFVKELEEALLGGTIDLAVHSMKDVPVALPAGLAIAAVLKREDPRDAFVSNTAKSLAEMPAGARVGTSSVRRAAQLRRARKDLEPVLLRGNVDTRLRKLDAGEMDAMLLALAGLKRLGLESRATQILDDFLPALSQGAIGIEIRDTDTHAREIVAQLNDEDTELALTFERAFQEGLDGTCHSPIAGLATIDGKTLNFRGEALASDGSDFVETSFKVELRDNAREIVARAGKDVGRELRTHTLNWPGF